MTDYVISAGRIPSYRPHHGGHVVGTRFTACEESDFAAAFGANVLAIPGLAVSMLKSSPVTVTDKFFGMHVNKLTSDTSSISFGSVRSHDMAGVPSQWQKIEPADDIWNFAEVDTWVDRHYAAGRDLIFTLFGTPTWASARPTEQGIWGPWSLGVQAEPADMTKWDRFCAKVALRYLGKIKYYEVWNEPNLNNDGTGPTAYGSASNSFFYSGTYAKLAEMTRRASQTIKAIDPTAKIISPATTSWGITAGSSGETYLTGMMNAATGDGSTVMKNWVDIVAVHLYGWGRTGTNIALQLDRVNAAKTALGVSAKETWDTESAPLSPDANDLNDDTLKKLIARTLITSAAKGVARSFYYLCDSSTHGFMERPAVIAYREQIINLLKSGTIQTVSRFADGRVGYYTTAGLKII